MSSTIFYSENGKLGLPESMRIDTTKYAPIEIGDPLCVEILLMSMGRIKDWAGKGEVMISSWAKTGGDARPAPRVINAYREELDDYENISDFGAEKFGHSLVYYTPAYKGETLRTSFEFLEIDQSSENIDKLASAVSGGLGKLPIFASQLPILSAISMLPDVVKIGRRLYNMLNPNDTLLKGDLDLSFNMPDRKILNPGRYVVVYGDINTANFISQYHLSDGSKAPINVLVNDQDQPIGNDGQLRQAYLVVQITSVEKFEYAGFEPVSQQQEFIGKVLPLIEDDDKLRQVASLINSVAESAKLGLTLRSVCDVGRNYLREKNAVKKDVLRKLLLGDITKISSDSVRDLMMTAFAL